MTLIRATHFGPAFAPGQPRQIVVHSVESEIVSGLARSLASGWFRNPANQTSAHTISDPAETIDMVVETQRAWHCGNGNSTSLGDEHVGRAAFTRAQWTTTAGMKMLRNAAKRTAQQCQDHNIRPRWLSLVQLANDEDGLCTHNDMRLVRGGTTHTDPGPGFPYDLYLQLVKEAMGPGKPTIQEDDMPYTEDQLRTIVREEVAAALRTVTIDTTDYSVRPPAPRKGRTLPQVLADTSNFASGSAYNAGQASNAAKKALAELQEGMKA